MGWLLEHLTDPHHLRLLAAITSGWVAVNYLVIGGMLVPSLAAPWRTTLYGTLFFIGCTLTHVMIAISVMTMHMPLWMLYAMSVVHVIQIAGGTGFVWDIARSRMVLRVEP